MERRAASHTEEEEMNQRRRLLSLARKGDVKAISKLFELYQVRVLSGDVLNKMNRSYYKSASQKKRTASGSGKAAKNEKRAHGNQKKRYPAPGKSSRKTKGSSGKKKAGR
ncbi:MAG: hypothetical protein ABW047_07725 [Nitrospiraceae bacterium]